MATTQIKLTNPETDFLRYHIESAAARGLPVVERDCCADAPGMFVIGVGPSLQNKKTLSRIRKHVKKGWKVIAIKDAITFLRDNKITVHYSAAMDPGKHQVGKTPVYPDVTYCIASSCHPDLFDHCLAGAPVVIYHSACGMSIDNYAAGMVYGLAQGVETVILGVEVYKTTKGDEFCPVVVESENEVSVYNKLFGNGDTMCGGYTVGNRALALAKYMGARKLVACGLDFGWRESSHYYGDFCKNPHREEVIMRDDSLVDGKLWLTRPDLMASAVDVAYKIKAGEMEVWGDSLAASLAKRDMEFLAKTCRIEKHLDPA